MRILLAFLLTVLITAVPSFGKVVKSENITGTKKIVSFYVTVNPTPVETTVKYAETKKKIETSWETSNITDVAERKVKLLLGAAALFLAVVGLWSSIKGFIVAFVSTRREGFGLKLVSGTVTFVISLAILFYALNLLKENF